MFGVVADRDFQVRKTTVLDLKSFGKRLVSVKGRSILFSVVVHEVL